MIVTESPGEAVATESESVGGPDPTTWYAGAPDVRWSAQMYQVPGFRFVGQMKVVVPKLPLLRDGVVSVPWLPLQSEFEDA